MTLLEVDRVGRRFGGVRAVDDVTFAIDEGDVLGVIGPNGAGKSTLLGLLAGEPRPTAGRIHLRGRDITSAKPHVRCRHGVSRTYQIPRPFGDLTVTRNVEIARSFGGADDAPRTGEIIARFGLSSRKHVRADELTHAEQRRLELARSVATGPALLLLDEMGAGLTEPELDDFAELIRQVSADGMAVIVVEHIMPLVMGVSHRILVLDAGRLIADGTPSEIADDPQVIAAYFGER